MDVPDATAQRRRSLRTRAQGPGRPLSRTRLFAKLIQTRPPFWEQYPLIPGSLYSTASCTPQLVGSGEDEWRLRGLQANTAVNEKRSPTATGCPGDEPAFRAKIAQSQESTLIKPAARRIPASWHRLRRPVLCVCVCVCVCVFDAGHALWRKARAARLPDCPGRLVSCPVSLGRQKGTREGRRRKARPASAGQHLVR